MVIRSGTTSIALKTITGLGRTGDLCSGLYIYGTGIATETGILTVDNATQVTMDKEARQSGTRSLLFTTARPGTYKDAVDFMTDIKNTVDERGEHLQIINRGEGDVVRDKYNSLAQRLQHTKLFMRAFPVEYQPTDKQLIKAGIREMSDVLIYTAALDWINAGVDFNDIDIIRNTMKLQGKTYEIKQKGRTTQLNDFYGYYTFALFEK